MQPSHTMPPHQQLQLHQSNSSQFTYPQRTAGSGSENGPRFPEYNQHQSQSYAAHESYELLPAVKNHTLHKQERRQEYHHQHLVPRSVVTSVASNTTAESSRVNNNTSSSNSTSSKKNNPNGLTTSTTATTSQPEFQCHHADCLRIFFRKTSLTNHLKAHNNLKSRSIYRTKRARQRAAAAAAALAAKQSQESHQLHTISNASQSTISPSPSPSDTPIPSPSPPQTQLAAPISSTSPVLPLPLPPQQSQLHYPQMQRTSHAPVNNNSVNITSSSMSLPPPFPMHPSHQQHLQQQHNAHIQKQALCNGNDENAWPPSLPSPNSGVNELSLSFPSPRVFGGDLDPPQSIELLFNPSTTNNMNTAVQSTVNQKQSNEPQPQMNSHAPLQKSSIPTANYGLNNSATYAALAASTTPLLSNQNEFGLHSQQAQQNLVRFNSSMALHSSEADTPLGHINNSLNGADTPPFQSQQDQNNNSNLDNRMETSSSGPNVKQIATESYPDGNQPYDHGNIDHKSHQYQVHSNDVQDVSNIDHTEAASTIAGTPSTIKDEEHSSSMVDTHNNCISPNYNSNTSASRQEVCRTKINGGGGGGGGTVGAIAHHGTIFDVTGGPEYNHVHSSATSDVGYLGGFENNFETMYDWDF